MQQLVNRVHWPETDSSDEEILSDGEPLSSDSEHSDNDIEISSENRAVPRVTD